jgi:L-arabinose isomerase
MTVDNRVRVGLVAGGLGAYWPQFPDLLPQLRRSAERVAERMRGLGAEVVDVGFVSDAQEGAVAAEKLRAAGCDIIVGFLTTYMTATMLVPVAQRSGAPVLLINLQPTESMDHETFDTGQWLAYCGACPTRSCAAASRSARSPVTWRTSGPGRRSGAGCGRPAYARRCGAGGTA